MMNYAVIGFLFAIMVVALYFFRDHWLPYTSSLSIPGSQHLYQALPTTFQGDVEAGLSSTTFDLAGNITNGDARAGLDDVSKAEILKIMKKRRLPFDEARKVYMEKCFKANGIGANGLPRDPKFVSFS